VCSGNLVCVRCVVSFPGLLDDRLHYFETLHHDTLRHQITKRDVENKPDGRILEYASHKRSVWHSSMWHFFSS